MVWNVLHTQFLEDPCLLYLYTHDGCSGKFNWSLYSEDLQLAIQADKAAHITRVLLIDSAHTNHSGCSHCLDGITRLVQFYIVPSQHFLSLLSPLLSLYEQSELI